NSFHGAIDARGVQKSDQTLSGLVLPAIADEAGSCPESRDIEGHVARAAQPFLNAVDPYHRDRGFGRNAGGSAVPIAIEHQIAGDQDAGRAEIRELHGFNETKTGAIGYHKHLRVLGTPL